MCMKFRQRICMYLLLVPTQEKQKDSYKHFAYKSMYTKGSCLFTYLLFLRIRFNFKLSLLPSISSSLIGLDKPSSSSWRSSIIWFWGLLSFSLKKISFLQRVNPRKLAEIYFFVEAGRSIYYLLLHSPIILLSPFKKKNQREHNELKRGKKSILTGQCTVCLKDQNQCFL